ncbi:MAG: hypothetical protein KOO63_13890 [Bacteroidales bacterium]|nr:hypothetical protein [Candidatus Latescibacterota bacterium]
MNDGIGTIDTLETMEIDESPDEGSGGTPEQLSSETFGVTCPECGGSIRVHEGEKSIKCRYCGSALYIMRPKGVRGFYLPPKISAGKARLEALHYLGEKTNGRVKARHASILDIQLINVPFWRMNGRLVGWVCGEKVTRRQIEVPTPSAHGVNINYKTVEERTPFSKLVFKKIDWSTPACSVRHLGLQGISLKASSLDWDKFDHDLKKKVNIALPMKPRKIAEKNGFKYLSSLTTPTGSIVRASRFRIFDNDFSLYYYPIYIMRYRHREIIYSITVDGNDGRIIRGNHPKRKHIDFRSMVYVPAAAAIMGLTWPPLIPITLVGLYTFDAFHNGTFIHPLNWIKGRLETWFGGEL